MYSTEIFGTYCRIQGSGNPNTLGITIPTGCIEGIYLNSQYSNRNPSSTVWVYDAGTSTWIARP